MRAAMPRSSRPPAIAGRPVEQVDDRLTGRRLVADPLRCGALALPQPPGELNECIEDLGRAIIVTALHDLPDRGVSAAQAGRYPWRSEDKGWRRKDRPGDTAGDGGRVTRCSVDLGRAPADQLPGVRPAQPAAPPVTRAIDPSIFMAILPRSGSGRAPA
jgi:hypothetical protein